MLKRERFRRLLSNLPPRKFSKAQNYDVKRNVERKCRMGRNECAYFINKFMSLSFLVV